MDMKKILSLVLTCVMAASLLLTSAAADGESNYTQDPSDYNAMVQCLQDDSHGITLTQEYFAIPQTIYGENTCIKLSFQSSAEGLKVAVFRMASKVVPQIVETEFKKTLTVGSETVELDLEDEQGAVGYGAYFGLNILTSVDTDTTLTVKVYAKNSSTGDTEYPATEAGTITYTVKAKENDDPGGGKVPLGMTVSCTDRSSVEAGNQVYVGDTVNVSFTNADSFAGTGAELSVGDNFELVGSVPTGWTANSSGGYTYTKSEGNSSELGKFTFKVIKSDTTGGTITLTSKFSGNTTSSSEETLYVIGKTIQYTIKGLNEANNEVAATYDGKPHHIEVEVTEPANAKIEYSATDIGDTTGGSAADWSSTPPEWTDSRFGKNPAWYTTSIKISAEGYTTVERSVNLYIATADVTIAPKDTTIYVGDRVPTSFDYTVSGLCGNDQLITHPTISVDGLVDTSKPGTYTIKASGADAGDNYLVHYDTATLRVVERPIDVPDTYDIEVIPSDNGTVRPSLSNASAGSTITLTVTPDEGYELAYITVDGERISGTSFTMPAHDVEVRAYFVRIGADMPFTDVNSGDWFYDYVRYVVANGLMEGTSATTFEPNANMTRAMVWTILARIDGETITGTSWQSDARAWAMESGVSDGTDPNGLVTREQFATMLYRYAGEPEVSGSLSAFTDATNVSDWAADAMLWATQNGIITGVTATTLDPHGTATRAQCAAMLMRFAEL